MYTCSIMKTEYNELPSLQIERPVYQIEELNRDQLYEKPHTTCKYIVGDKRMLDDFIIIPQLFASTAGYRPPPFFSTASCLERDLLN